MLVTLDMCNGVGWSKDKTQAAESIKWRPQQAYGSNQFLLVQPQTVFSTHTKSFGSNLDMYINQSYALDVDSAAPRHIAYQFAQKRVKSLYLVQC